MTTESPGRSWTNDAIVGMRLNGIEVMNMSTSRATSEASTAVAPNRSSPGSMVSGPAGVCDLHGVTRLAQSACHRATNGAGAQYSDPHAADLRVRGIATLRQIDAHLYGRVQGVRNVFVRMRSGPHWQWSTCAEPCLVNQGFSCPQTQILAGCRNNVTYVIRLLDTMSTRWSRQPRDPAGAQGRCAFTAGPRSSWRTSRCDSGARSVIKQPCDPSATPAGRSRRPLDGYRRGGTGIRQKGAVTRS